MQIEEATRAADAHDRLGNGNIPSYTAGVCSCWEGVGPCHKQRHLLYRAPSAKTSNTSEVEETEALEAATGDSVEVGSLSGGVVGDASRGGDDSPAPRAGALLEECASTFLRSSAFAKFLLRITDLSIQVSDNQPVLRFSK